MKTSAHGCKKSKRKQEGLQDSNDVILKSKKIELKLDFRNAFNSIDRAVIPELVKSVEELRWIYRFFQAILPPATPSRENTVPRRLTSDA